VLNVQVPYVFKNIVDLLSIQGDMLLVAPISLLISCMSPVVIVTHL
jgi:hypothetical protein